VYQMRHEYVPRIQMMIAERKRMTTLLDKLPGVTVYPSETNFILIKYAKAVKLNKYLEEQGIGVRSFGDKPGLKNCLRISMGLREENDTWYEAVKTFVEGRI
ncbi:MAG: aminotransferase class I/II-fold pyridoxal phosphate-dependent enzyme, partial [Selenomonas sp.]|nr:aminotransferase class I/II-fold pyridoxal phosphate-dependent enzyme [Selenomonas sp.]